MKIHPLWRASALRATIEAFLLAALLAVALLLVSDPLPPQAVDQGFVFISLASAALCALRLRPSHGRWWRCILRELRAAVGLGLALSGGLMLPLYFSKWRETLDRTNFHFGGLVAVLLAGGAAFIAFRCGVCVWHFWDRLRRRRLRWELTHAHLTTAAAIVLLYTLFFALAVILSGEFTPFEPQEEGGFAAWVADRIIRTAFPIAGVTAVIVVTALAVVLPPSAVVSYFAARRTTRRLESLAAAAKALRTGDLSARVDVVGQDEVAQLKADFNAMAAELEGSVRALEAERDKVATLLQSRRELIATVSHELRTPTATVRGYLESAIEGWDESPPPTLRHDLVVMEEEIERLQGLIDDLFTLARVDVQGLAMDLRAVDADEVIRRQVEAMARLAWQAGRVELVAELPPDLPPVLADEGRLEQVLVNLLRNAIRHTPPGGIVAVGGAAEGDRVRIDVRDTGEGIPPDDLPHIWERFYRGQATRAEDSRGAGLGLALVKDLTQAMGGSAHVKSVLGQGTCFTIKLPTSCPPLVFDV